MLQKIKSTFAPLVIFLYSAAASAQMLESKAESIGNRIVGLAQMIVTPIAVLAVIGASIAFMTAEPDAKRKLVGVIVGAALAAVAPFIYPWIAGA